MYLVIIAGTSSEKSLLYQRILIITNYAMIFVILSIIMLIEIQVNEKQFYR